MQIKSAFTATAAWDEVLRPPQQAQAAQRQMALARYGKVQLPQTQQAQEILALDFYIILSILRE